MHTRQEAQLVLEREQLRRELRAEMSDIAVLAAIKSAAHAINPRAAIRGGGSDHQ